MTQFAAHTILALAVSAILLTGTTTPRAQDMEATYAAIAEASVIHHILPRYARLAQSGETLAEAATRYCAARDPETFRSLDQAFRTYWLTWADIRHIQFGPVTYLDRTFRIQFWPDTRNRIGKQLQRTLATADNAALAPERFARTSVAIQGLPALERLLAQGHTGYGGAEGAFRCALTKTIAGNLAVMAAGTSANWSDDGGYAHLIATAGEIASPYAETSEVPIDLLQSLLAEIEASRDLRLGRPLGSSGDKARPKLAEAWRSGLSRDIMLRSLQGIGDLYRNGGFDAALRSTGDAALADRIEDAVQRITSQVSALGIPMYEAYSSTEGRERLEAIRAELRHLAALVGTDLAVALEISPGFNARDGD